jgi:hypothetical protein
LTMNWLHYQLFCCQQIFANVWVVVNVCECVERRYDWLQQNINILLNHNSFDYLVFVKTEDVNRNNFNFWKTQTIEYLFIKWFICWTINWKL